MRKMLTLKRWCFLGECRLSRNVLDDTTSQLILESIWTEYSNTKLNAIYSFVAHRFRVVLPAWLLYQTDKLNEKIYWYLNNFTKIYTGVAENNWWFWSNRKARLGSSWDRMWAVVKVGISLVMCLVPAICTKFAWGKPNWGDWSYKQYLL